MSNAYSRTGQHSCHDTVGREIACPGSGQDGELRCGLAWPSPRFEIAGETVADRLTHLIWARNAALAEFPLTWQEALDFIAALNNSGFAGQSDWRLPNRRELRSLIDHQQRRPAIPAGHPFTGIFNGWYWTGTSAAIRPNHAWYVDVGGGRMFYGGKDQSFMLWPVRDNGPPMLPRTGQRRCFDSKGVVQDCTGSGQDGELRRGIVWPAPRFEGDEHEVIDRLTGLAWRRHADLAGGAVTWAEALERVAALNSGAGPWRLPNINELESLVDCATHSPALPHGHPFVALHDIYWSSTTSLFEPDWAWALYLEKGALGVGHKPFARFHVWSVRDA